MACFVKNVVHNSDY